VFGSLEKYAHGSIFTHLRSALKLVSVNSTFYSNVLTKTFSSASELYQPSDRRLSAKLVPTFADRGCRVVSATEPPAINSVFLTGAAIFSFK
jgi:hypothetical protein